MSTQVTLLRDRRTKPRDFRGLLRELSSYVGYEATRSLSTVPRHDCVTPRGVHVLACVLRRIARDLRKPPRHRTIASMAWNLYAIEQAPEL